MNYSNLRLSTANGYGWIKSHGILLIIVCAVFIVAFNGLSRYLDRRAELREDTRTAKSDHVFAEKMEIFQNFMEMANRDHQATMTVLDNIQLMTKNIDTLAANDREITMRVNKINEEEYKNARSQKNNQKAVSGRTARSNVPLRQREQSALATDAELYPDN